MTLIREPGMRTVKNKPQKKRRPFQPLDDGQVWQYEDWRIQIEMVGRTLVHYKSYKADTKRPPVQLARKEVLQQFLLKKDAVLLKGQALLPPATGGSQIQFGRSAVTPMSRASS
jgi:hypothetical protein